MTLMVALIGEQTLPNLLPIRHYQPESVLLVYTSRTEAMSQRLQALLLKDTKVHMLETDAYDIKDISSKLTKKLEELGAASLLFNLTGGTKSMVLAAYQVAQNYVAPVFYFQSEGKTNKIYYYVWKHGRLVAQLDEKSKNGFPEYLTLNDFFDVQLGRNTWHEAGPSYNGSKRDGGFFEKAIADALRSHKYEVMCGVKAFNDQVDVDVAVRYENQVGVIEAKIGDQARRLDGVRQLNTSKQHLGTYTRLFYVINTTHSESQRVIIEASNIKVISLLEYVANAVSLTPNDTDKLIKEIEGVMKG